MPGPVPSPWIALRRWLAALCMTLLAANPMVAQTPDRPLFLNDDGLPTLAPLLAEVTPAVVNISVETRQDVESNPLFADPFFRRYFDLPPMPQPSPRQQMSAGSGVIVDAEEGYVLTNHHVVAEGDRIVVTLKDRRRFEAELVGSDPGTDIALLQIEAEDIAELELGDSDRLEVGDYVLAIGNPFGLGQTVTSGIVSALGRSGLNVDGYEDFIQTDASINPGNSGGALVNLKGELVGINSAILSRTGGNIGIGFAIPSNLVNSVYRQIAENGEVQRARLGVVGQNLTSDLASAFDLDITQGVVVAQVMPDSPASKAGIKERDVITHVNDKKIDDFSELANAIGLRSPGEKVTVTLMRNGKQRELKATLANAKDVASNSGSSDAGSSNELAAGLDGATFGPITEDSEMAGEVEGVVVTDVERGSAAARAGLRPDDIITSINRRAISDVSQLSELAGPDVKQLLLHVRRGQGALFLLIR